MPGSRQNPKIPGGAWIALAAIAVVVPMLLSVAVPVLRPADTPPPAPIVSSAAPSDVAADSAPGVTAPDTSPNASQGVVPDAAPASIESEQAMLRIEKAAIEAEESRLRGNRGELEAFEREHADGVPPELYARYEDARATFNSDVKAFKSRAAAYSMKVAELERRIEAQHPDSP